MNIVNSLSKLLIVLVFAVLFVSASSNAFWGAAIRGATRGIAAIAKTAPKAAAAANKVAATAKSPAVQNLAAKASTAATKLQEMTAKASPVVGGVQDVKAPTAEQQAAAKAAVQEVQVAKTELRQADTQLEQALSVKTAGLANELNHSAKVEFASMRASGQDDEGGSSASVDQELADLLAELRAIDAELDSEEEALPALNEFDEVEAA